MANPKLFKATFTFREHVEGVENLQGLQDWFLSCGHSKGVATHNSSGTTINFSTSLPHRKGLPP